MSEEYFDLVEISITNYQGAYFEGKVQGWQKVKIDFLHKTIQQAFYFPDFENGERPLFIVGGGIDRQWAEAMRDEAYEQNVHLWLEGPSLEGNVDWELATVFGTYQETLRGNGEGPAEAQVFLDYLFSHFETFYPGASFLPVIPEEAQQQWLAAEYYRQLRIQKNYLAAPQEIRLLKSQEQKNPAKEIAAVEATNQVIAKIHKRMELAGEIDQAVLDFIGSFIYDYRMSIGGFKKNVAENAYRYGFFLFPRLLTGHQEVFDKSIFTMLEDALNLGVRSQPPLIAKEDVLVVLKNLEIGFSDWQRMMEDPLLKDLGISIMTGGRFKAKAAEPPVVSRFADCALWEGVPSAIEENLDFLPMFDHRKDEHIVAFRQELLMLLVREVGYEPALWDVDDLEYVGNEYFGELLDEYQLDFEGGLITVGTVLLSLNHGNDYPEEQQIYPMLKGLITGYNNRLEEDGAEQVPLPSDKELQELLNRYEVKELKQLFLYQGKRNPTNKKEAQKKNKRNKKMTPAKSPQIMALEDYHKKMKKKRK